MAMETCSLVCDSHTPSPRSAYHPNTTVSHDSINPRPQTETLTLFLYLLYPIAVSFAAWLLSAFAASFVTVRYNGHGHSGQTRHRPSFNDRLRFALIPAVVMTAIQCGLMALRAQPQVGDTYEVKMTGEREDYETSPLWRLAAGCWFLAIGVGLTVVGVIGVVLEGAKWREEMKEAELPPPCP